MATHYVDSAAAGANNGTSKTDAWTSLGSAVGVAAGDDIWISHTHNETVAASTAWNFSNGTAASPVVITSVNFGTDAYTAASSAQFSGAGSDLSLSGNIVCRGLYIGVADDVTLGGNDFQRYYQCTFAPGDDIAVRFANGGIKEFESCSFVLVAATQFNLTGGGDNGAVGFYRNCTFSGTAGTLIQSLGHGTGNIFECCDISLFSAIVPNLATGNYIELRRCKVHASLVIGGTALTSQSSYALIESCDDGTITVPPLGVTQYKNIAGTVAATLAQYRTGGANDGINANAYSWEMISTAATKERYVALVSPPLTVFSAADGSISGATARGIFTTSRVLPLASEAALTTDGTSTWNGSGVGTKQQVSVTLSNGATLTVYVASGGTLNDDDFWIEVSEPDQVGGPVSVRCFLAKPSTTVYLDPFPVISGTTSSRQWFAEGVQFAGGDESGGSGGSRGVIIGG